MSKPKGIIVIELPEVPEDCYHCNQKDGRLLRARRKVRGSLCKTGRTASAVPDSGDAGSYARRFTGSHTAYRRGGRVL